MLPGVMWIYMFTEGLVRITWFKVVMLMKKNLGTWQVNGGGIFQQMDILAFLEYMHTWVSTSGWHLPVSGKPGFFIDSFFHAGVRQNNGGSRCPPRNPQVTKWGKKHWSSIFKQVTSLNERRKERWSETEANYLLYHRIISLGARRIKEFLRSPNPTSQITEEMKTQVY